MKPYYSNYIKGVERYYSKNYKKYHTIHHIISMFKLYDLHRDEFLKEFPDLKEDELLEAIAWHDSVYIPGCELNEEFSAELYVKDCDNNRKPWNRNVYHAILSTKIGTEIFMGGVEKILHDLDWSGFCGYFHEVKLNQERILFEATYDYAYTEKEVKENQLKFYKSIVNKNLYVTNTFKMLAANENAKKNITLMINEMENKNV